MKVKTYYQLTKPGIVRGNLITAVAGFLLAAHGHVQATDFVALAAGISLVISGACVFNNYIDRGIDARMERTRSRALVKGEVPGRSALLYGTTLAVLGFGILAAWTNWLTVLVTAVGFVDYVVVYGWAKRTTVHSTLVGSISGAVPILAGYVAARGHFDLAGWLVFLIMVVWQMPHFYAIGIYRRDDYAAAGMPILTVKKGFNEAKIQIVTYVVIFVLAVLALAWFGYAGRVYLVLMAIAGGWWLWQGLRGFRVRDEVRWAKSMFGLSLIEMMLFSALIALNWLLP